MKNMTGRIICTYYFKLFIAAACTLAAIAIVCGLSILKSATVHAPSGANQITVHGTIACLPWKESVEAHTMECAYGLEDAAGTYYALHDADPSSANIAAAPTGTQVTVMGIFTYDDSTNYQSIGTLEVTAISVDAR